MEIPMEAPTAEPTSAAADETIGATAPDQASVYDFEDDEAGSLPEGFSAGLTGGRGATDWRVVEADDAPSGNNVVAHKTEDGRRTNIGVRGRGDAHGVDASVPEGWGCGGRPTR